MNELKEVRIKRLSKDAIIPKKAYEHDAGFDLHAAENIVLKPLERKLVKTGIALELPKGYHAEIRPRSGLALKHGITILNTPATIDTGYRGEIMIILANLGNEPFEVNKGERIAQLVFSQVHNVNLKEVEELSETQRGEKGFGSSGV
ncbi:deoxyuridine 5'-triphosphate nucleotidohydrolase [Candidatus Pacearchaeota archaeon ex4484_26]|nr:MAG: deoxyuridine 5'-triphosphate nucleotidohydrolase [Candidatus Pacearchaeota archaeon ex4484_26]